jgi:hypothetical protein
METARLMEITPSKATAAPRQLAFVITELEPGEPSAVSLN